MKPTLLPMIILTFLVGLFFYLSVGQTKPFEFKSMARGYSVHDMSKRELWPEWEWKIRKRGIEVKERLWN